MEFKGYYENLCKKAGAKRTLERMRLIHKEVGSPGDSLKIIHITGTNGKGTVSLNIAHALEENGLKVGLFTSPHYERMNERIAINGVCITDEHLEEIYQNYKSQFSNLMFFEYLAITAFIYFAEQKVDYAVIEVGIGGLRDSTNIVDTVLSVITNISMDHQSFLGDTLESVAIHKAGIIKENKIVVLGPKARHKIVLETAAKKKAKVYGICEVFDDFLEENLEIAKLAVGALGYKPAKNFYKHPARFEVCGDVIYDMAHNDAAFLALKEKMQKHYPDKKIIALWNMSPIKAVSACLKILQSFTHEVYFFKGEADRLMNLEKAQTLGLQEYADQEGDIYLVCGSIYIMKEAKKLFTEKKQLQMQ